MKHSGVKGLGRLLSVLMVAAMLMTTWIVPALALDNWADLTVFVTWTDAQGEMQSTQAMPVPNNAEHAYWATLDSSALFTTVSVQVNYPDTSYTFYLNDYTLQLLWTQDADSLDTLYAQYIGYDVNSVYSGMFPLYLSSRDMPSDTTSGPESSVDIPVRYVTTDGVQLDMQYVMCYPNQFTQVYANSSAVWDYELVDPALRRD